MSYLSNLPFYLLSLPIVLLSLSVHETAHGFVAYKLGDPTAKNMGRLTLNPLKHLDPLGAICMLLFRFGWAKPVPIYSRNFKKPRRDMALSAAAGPVSNILLAFIFAALLRLEIGLSLHFFEEDFSRVLIGATSSVSTGFNMMCALSYMLYMGVVMNIGLAIFNLIPIPPFDGSRLMYVFLPPKWYFGLMKYERYIMLGILALMLFTPIVSTGVSSASNWLSNLIMKTFGFYSYSNESSLAFNIMINNLFSALSRA